MNFGPGYRIYYVQNGEEFVSLWKEFEEAKSAEAIFLKQIDKFDETHAVESWEAVVGKAVANRTKEIFIREKKLFVRIESSVVKNELTIMRAKIIDNLNEKIRFNTCGAML